MSEPMVPTTPEETAHTLAILRAIVATLVSRKRGPLILTEKARRHAYGVVLRVTIGDEGTIKAWIEPPQQDMRFGVVYTSEPKP